MAKRNGQRQMSSSAGNGFDIQASAKMFGTILHVCQAESAAFLRRIDDVRRQSHAVVANLCNQPAIPQFDFQDSFLTSGVAGDIVNPFLEEEKHLAPLLGIEAECPQLVGNL